MHELAGANGMNPTRTSQPCPSRSGNLPGHRARLPATPLAIHGYKALPRFTPYPSTAQAQASVPSSKQTMPSS